MEPTQQAQPPQPKPAKPRKPRAPKPVNATPKAPAAPVDDLDRLAGNLELAVMLMLWQDRMKNPDMFRQLNETDLKGFEDCTRYLKVRPKLVLERPQGLPEQPAIPAQGNRRAVPARPATPPKPYVMVKLLDHEGNAFRPIENNEADFDTSQDAALVRRMRERAPSLAQRLVQMGNSGEYSLSDLQDAADALLVLSRA